MFAFCYLTSFEFDQFKPLGFQHALEEVQTITCHGKVGLHFIVQPLRSFPHFAAATPALHGDAPLQLQDALPVEFDGQLFLIFIVFINFQCLRNVFERTPVVMLLLGQQRIARTDLASARRPLDGHFATFTVD